MTTVSLAAALSFTPTITLADEPWVVNDLSVVLLDDVEVPATETGPLVEVLVREGNSVTRGQTLARLDDREAQLEQKTAETELEIAVALAENSHAAELAEKDLSQKKQLSKQHELLRGIARRKAENQVRILASVKAEGVAKNELDRATRARQQFVDSVSRSEIDGLRLSYDRTKLETKQAEFERQIDELTANSEDEATAVHLLNIESAKIELARAVDSQRIAGLQAELKRHETALAKLAVAKRQIISPIDGIVVELLQKSGDWVKQGDPLMRVVRLNRLRAEGFVPSHMISQLRKQRSVVLSGSFEPGQTVERQGRIVFISPEVDPVNNEVRFWVEFDNPELDVLPGMRMTMTSDEL